MTSEVYRAKEKEYFETNKIPEELQGPISYMAWEIGHSNGYHEVWIHLQDFIDTLADPIDQLERRIRTEERRACI